MSESKLQIWLERRRVFERKLQLLLASAGACIGFSVTQIESTSSEVGVYFVCLALVAFGTSFLCGLRVFSLDADALQANLTLIRLNTKMGPEHYDEIAKSGDELKFSPIAKKWIFIEKIQILCLFLGAALMAASRLLDCEVCRQAFGI